MKQEYFDFSGTSNDLPRQIIIATIDDILRLTMSKLHKREKDLVVLDVGSGFGDYTNELAKRTKKVVGVEPYEKAYSIAKHNGKKYKNLTFFNKMIENFTTKDKFDLIVSLTTLEHMPNAKLSYKKIFQLLKPGGVLYVTAPNKLWPFESHYALPFLAWLPLPIANKYLEIFRHKKSYKDCSYSKTYFEVRKLFDNFPCTYEFIIPDPSAPYIGLGKTHNSYFLKISLGLLKRFPFLWLISKGFILLIVKKK